jgi:hypothetical protein
MDGVEAQQRETLQRLRDKLIESRALRAERKNLADQKFREQLADLERKTQKAAE